MRSKHPRAHRSTSYLLDEQLFTHCSAFVQTLLETFQQLLLLIYLSTEVTVCLRRDNANHFTIPAQFTYKRIRVLWHSPWADHLSFLLSSQGRDSYCSQVQPVSTVSDPSGTRAARDDQIKGEREKIEEGTTLTSQFMWYNTIYNTIILTRSSCFYIFNNPCRAPLSVNVCSARLPASECASHVCFYSVMNMFESKRYLHTFAAQVFWIHSVVSETQAGGWRAVLSHLLSDKHHHEELKSENGLKTLSIPSPNIKHEPLQLPQVQNESSAVSAGSEGDPWRD